MVSGVPQGSVLGHILFIIYVNDLDEGVVSRLFKFADDTKLVGRAESGVEINELQKDLDRLVDWAFEWQMEFNFEKCKIMHIGHNNARTKYKMNGINLQEVEVEKDLGVICCSDQKVASQCGAAAKKGYKVLEMINKTFTCKNKSVTIKLYKSLVKPHLDYCIQAWRPHLVKDLETIERVQRRATRMMEECRGRSYEERLKMTGLTT